MLNNDEREALIDAKITSRLKVMTKADLQYFYREQMEDWLLDWSDEELAFHMAIWACTQHSLIITAIALSVEALSLCTRSR